ncbi:hypothetical protein Tco_1479976 [Tanacetum coccineum]
MSLFRHVYPYSYEISWGDSLPITRTKVVPLSKDREKSHERILDVELEEDPEEDPQEDSEEEGESNKKRLKKASKSNSNTWPLDKSTSDEETDLEL